MNHDLIVSRLASTHGVVSILAGDVHWSNPTCDPVGKATLEACARLLHVSQQPEIRVVLGPNTVTATEIDGTYVVIAIPTGHSIAKSLKRMVRRAVKHGKDPKYTGQVHVPPALTDEQNRVKATLEEKFA